MAMRPTILVTGGAGYIGSHCCSLLSKSGFNPVAFDNLSTGHEDFVKWGPLVVGDIRDRASVEGALRKYQISSVMHFAAASSVGESIANPAKYYSNNVSGTLALLDAMHAVGCARLVFSSSGAVYGERGETLIAENASCDPVNPYGRTKLVVENIVKDYSASSGLRAISLRYFNASGAETSGYIGELREPETHLIPRALMKLQGHLAEFAVFGEDYDTQDGTAVRDYIHVVDLAVAHKLALQALDGGMHGGTFNLGTGKGYSVKQIVDAIQRLTSRNLEFVRKGRRTGDPATLVADPTAARRILAFSPTASDLDTIISSAWRWHLKAHPRRSTHAGATKSSSDEIVN
jgi:UDP-arabinose 4-epimerase